MIVDAILLAAGSGNRFDSQLSTPKQFESIGGDAVLVYGVRALLSLNCIRTVVVAVPAGLRDLARGLLEPLTAKHHASLQVIEGGLTRQESSQKCLMSVESFGLPPDRVVIHDASRPYLSRAFLSRIREKIFDRAYGSWIPTIPSTDTLKVVDNNRVIETLNRNSVHRVQTPQIFEYAVIRSLIDRVREFPHLEFTDDASLCEYAGIPVGTFEGDVSNIKMTYAFDKATLISLLQNSGAREICASELDTTSTV